MHVNTNYANAPWPTNSLIGQDPFPFIQHLYNPVLGISTVAGDQVENWPPEFNDQKDAQGNYDRIVPQLPGQRALIAVVDQGDSAAFLFPSTGLPNASCTVTSPVNMAKKCTFVQPTTVGMDAALQDLSKMGDGTKQPNPASTNKDAYPLTMVVYAVVPTSGISHAKAAAIAKFLDFAAGAGQHTGVQPGQLPPGFAPLPASMRAQTRQDASDVLHQTRRHPAHQDEQFRLRLRLRLGGWIRVVESGEEPGVGGAALRSASSPPARAGQWGLPGGRRGRAPGVDDPVHRPRAADPGRAGGAGRLVIAHRFLQHADLRPAAPDR